MRWSHPATIVFALLALAALPARGAGPPAAARRTAATLPDWSGAWVLDQESFARVRESSDSPDPANPNVPRLTQPYRDYRLVNKVQNRGLDGKGARNNAAACIPDGMPSMMSTPMAHEYLFTPGRVTVILENGEVRRIWTDGRPHPEDPDPKFSGHSVGHWEGDVLVVDTVAILPKAEIVVGLPGAPGTHVSERIRRISPAKLRIDTVVENPAIFTAPFSYARTFDHVDGLEEALCMENNRDNNGSIDLTPPEPRP